jgi:hypothetical protein
MLARRNPHRPGRAQCTHTGPHAERLLPCQAFPCATVHRRAGDRVRERHVSPLEPYGECSARRLLPSRGARGPPFPTFTGPMLRDDGPPAPLGGRRWSSCPATVRAPAVRGLPRGLVAWWTPQDDARAWGHPVPAAGHGAWRPVALPRSRVPPLKPCPALCPRGGPVHTPSRAQDGGLPERAPRRRSPHDRPEGSPAVHDSTPCGAPSRGRPSRSPRLCTAPCGAARGCATALLARR